MRISNVSNEEGRLCAQLINFIKAGRWDLNGHEAEELVKVKNWVVALAKLMAADLSPDSSQVPPIMVKEKAPQKQLSEPGFKVKSIGKLPTKSKKK